MGDLKPLGSEKLQGMEKIKRMLEISKFKENIPQPINETSKDQYRITLADGNEYQIVREKSGYIIKKTISESVAEYIDPMKHRKYYPSYSQALKRLNLMAKETNTLFENEEGISLFEQKKFVLKTPKPAAPPPPPADEVENVPPPPPAPDAGSEAPPPSDDMGGDMPPPPAEGGEETPATDGDESGMDMGDEEIGGEEQDEVVTFKSIQKLVGRLGQKLRKIGADEENKMTSKDIKYVINSVLSALNLNELDEDDREQIINKFEGIEDESSDETSSDTTEPSGDEEQGLDTGSEDSTEEPTEVGEMTETWSDFGEEVASKTLGKSITPGEFAENEDKFGSVKIMADEMFAEQKVENILSKYFLISENEKRINKIKNTQKKIITSEKNKNLAKEIKRLSESVLQEIAARKFLKEKPTFNFVGKSNKKNLVFENKNLKQVKISPEGNIL